MNHPCWKTSIHHKIKNLSYILGESGAFITEKDFHHWVSGQMGELSEIYLHDPDIHDDGVITNLELNIWMWSPWA